MIYALGGYNGRTRMASVERYYPDRNQWEMTTPMNKQRSDASAASLGGKVHILLNIKIISWHRLADN